MTSPGHSLIRRITRCPFMFFNFLREGAFVILAYYDGRWIRSPVGAAAACDCVLSPTPPYHVQACLRPPPSDMARPAPSRGLPLNNRPPPYLAHHLQLPTIRAQTSLPYSYWGLGQQVIEQPAFPTYPDYGRHRSYQLPSNC